LLREGTIVDATIEEKVVYGAKAYSNQKRKDEYKARETRKNPNIVLRVIIRGVCS